MTLPFTIANRRIGGDAPCFVIAEAGVNHNGDVDTALALVDAAAAAGADAVKFQTFSAKALATATAPKAGYQTRSAPTSKTQREMLAELELDEAAHRVLMRRAQERGLVFLSSPFEEDSARLLVRLGVPAFKVPSGELTNVPFLEHLARQSRPMIVSTGMADLEEVTAAVDAICRAGNPPIALLHCVSAYPANPDDANLRAMAALHLAFKVPVGWSDHTRDWDISIAAVALGASIIEKHLTLDRAAPGPDHAASLEPSDFTHMIASIRRVERALGDGVKRPVAAEAEIAAVARKSVVAARNLPAGHILAPGDLAVQRPGTGLAPRFLSGLIGQRLKCGIGAGELLRRDQLE